MIRYYDYKYSDVERLCKSLYGLDSSNPNSLVGNSVLEYELRCLVFNDNYFDNNINVEMIDVEMGYRFVEVSDDEGKNEFYMHCLNLYTYMLCHGIVVSYYNWVGYEDLGLYVNGDWAYFKEKDVNHLKYGLYRSMKVSDLFVEHWVRKHLMELKEKVIN